MMKHIIFLFLICAFIPAFAQDDITVESRVDSSRIHIGDVVTYSVIVDHDSNMDVQMPQLAENLGMFEIRDFTLFEPKEKNGRIRAQTDYLISTFDVGEYTIPELTVGYKLESDSIYNFIKTKPITIVVESLNPDEAGDIRDIKMPKTPPRDWKSIVLIVILSVLGVAALIFLYIYMKRRKEGRGVFEKAPEPPRPPHEIALEKLNALVSSDLLEKGLIKEYISELSDTVREYIGGRYYVDALEMTSDQLLAELKTACVDDECVARIATFLPPCDMVKFAKYIPSQDNIEDLTQQAFTFVDQSKLDYSQESTVELAEDKQPAEEELKALPQAEEKAGEDTDV